MNAIRQLIGEIHRRSVWQVLAVYLFGSWLGYEVVLALTEGIGLPAWVPGLAVALFVVGLPIVLATAVVQEGHPLQGESGTGRGDRPGPGVEGLETAAAAVTRAPEAAARPRSVDRASEQAGRSVDERAGATDQAPGAQTGVDPGVEGAGRSSQRQDGIAGLLTWRRATTAGVLAFAGLGLVTTGFLGMRSLGIGPAATLVSSGAMEQGDVVVLADFTGDDREVADLVTEALRIDLTESTAFSLAEPRYLRGVLQRMEQEPAEGIGPETAREVALREGLPAIIVGEVRELGGRYLLTANVESSADGTVLAAFREDAEGEAGLLEAVDALGTGIREKVGESLRSVRRSEPLEAVTTSSLPALRLFSRAVQALNRTGNPALAEALLLRAVAEDSTFAVAWRALGIQLSNDGRDPERAREAFAQAYRFRDRLQDHERLMSEATYHAYVEGDPDAAAQAYRALLELHPDYTPALNNLALYHQNRGQYEEALRLVRRTVELEGDALHWNNLAYALINTGHADQALEVALQGQREFPDNLMLVYAAGVAAGIQDRFELADSVAEAVLAAPDAGVGQVMARVLRGASAAMRGRIEDATRDYREAARLALRLRAYGTIPNAVAPLLDLHVLARGDMDAAAAEFDQILRQADPDSVPAAGAHTFAATMLARVGAADRATAMLARDAEVRQAAGWSPDEGALHATRGLVALAQGRPAETVREFRARQNAAPVCPACDLGVMGEAFVALEQPDSAIAAWTRALEVQHASNLVLASAWRPYIARRLGELHDAAGDTDAALRYYTRFLEWWTDPDPGLEPVVSSVRERVAFLTRQPD